MNRFHDHFRNSVGFRDTVFQFAADLLPKDKEVKIVEIGGPRSLSKYSRITDGWSTLFWLNALPEARIWVNDVDPLVFENLRLMTTGLDIRGRVLTWSEKDYLLTNPNLSLALCSLPADLFYLDGSDDPRETKDQFEWAIENSPNAVIVIDDYNYSHTGKGRLVHERYSTELANRVFSLPVDFEGWKTTHSMAVYHSSLAEKV